MNANNIKDQGYQGNDFMEIDSNVLMKESYFKRHKGIIVFGGIILMILILTGLLVSCIRGGNSYEAKKIGHPYVAVIYVNGTIAESTETDYFGTPIGYNHSWTLNQIKALSDDENNKGLLLYVNSPGGGIYESAELYNQLLDYQNKTGRPLYTYMAQYAASGGYYIAAPSDKIIANMNTMTGSIGVYLGPILDLSGLLERLGVDVTIIKSSDNKAMGNSYEPMTEEQARIYQSMVDEYYEQFVKVVSEGRDMDITVVKKIADGRAYTANQALANGLIDDISGYEEAKAYMLKENGLEGTEFYDIQYVQKLSLLSLFFGIASEVRDAIASFNNSELEGVIELADEYNDMPISYMMTVK